MLRKFNTLFIALLVFVAAFCFYASFSSKDAEAVEIITHWVPHEVYGMPGDPDNSG
ncbi:MAG: hypothetical protein H8D23_04850, partial [Candidatus Brocadiales bacterium]|nr:hypothetical protein [Candidatus Brocadiales bacterium]